MLGCRPLLMRSSRAPETLAGEEGEFAGSAAAWSYQTFCWLCTNLSLTTSYAFEKNFLKDVVKH